MRSAWRAGNHAHPAPYWLLALAALAVLALVAPRTIRSVRRRQRWRRAADDRGRAEAAWAELQDDLTDYRVAWSPTPRRARWPAR